MSDKQAHLVSHANSLCSKALPHLTESRIDAVVNEAVAVSHLLEPICKSLPMLPRQLVFPVALTATVHHGLGRRIAQVVQSELMLWAFAFDDELDLNDPFELHVDQLLWECEVAASGNREGFTWTHEVTHALSIILNRLRAAPSWSIVAPFWKREFDSFLDASRQERHFSGALQESSIDSLLDDYLAFARHSIALPWLLMAGLAFEDVDSLAVSLRALADLAVQCGSAARLSNDLATYRRELTECRINSVTLLAHQSQFGDAAAASSVERATRLVRARLERETEVARHLAAMISTKSHVAERFLNVLSIGNTIYSEADFRILLVADSAHDISRKNEAGGDVLHA